MRLQSISTSMCDEVSTMSGEEYIKSRSTCKCRFTRDLLDVNKALVSSREKQLGKTSSKVRGIAACTLCL
ncbi:hypothetical protein HZH66_012296 [Vespula vulgaris]|uniref:Uncharacterized protein n=1 Tax=Vespula vulgaris TaxID=7454 RepID=A0A834JBV9_VESVU|nr:hypothetical protein HZH66_012296 [Vespula vulgaris]